MTKIVSRSLVLVGTLAAACGLEPRGPAEVDAGGDAAPASEVLSTTEWISFVSNRHSHFEVFLVHPDGTDEHAVVSNAGQNLGPTWSPDGTKLAFHSDRSGSWLIYVLDLATGVQTPLETGQPFSVSPAFSPDGTRIAFGGRGPDGDAILFVVPAEGGVAIPITGPAPAGGTLFRDNSPVWSPDGTRIYFATNRGGGFDVYRVSPTGADLTRVTDGTEIIGGPAVSPDGGTITYSQVEGDGTQIADLDLATRATRVAMSTNDSEPSYSPGGGWLAVTTLRYGVQNPEVVLVDQRAGQVVRLTNSRAAEGAASFQPGAK